MGTARRQAFRSERKRLWTLLLAGVVTLSALLAAPVGATNLRGKGEVNVGDVHMNSSTLAEDPLPVEITSVEDATEERITTVGENVTLVVSSEDVVSDFLASTTLWDTDVLLGMYTSASLQVTAHEIAQIDGWLVANNLDTRVAIAGTFMDVEFPNPDWNVWADLNAAWDQGAIPFVNLAVGTTDNGPRSASDVADGVIDDVLRAWASIFAQWTNNGERKAFIAPLQEMNSDWVTYGLDPDSYKAAFARFQRIFAEEGVPEEAVLWVFAPNGWSMPGHEFEGYYPGDDIVDVVGFSAFNFGACVADGHGWDPYNVVIEPYLDRMRLMAPDKPVFLAQTGTVEQGGDKGEWLKDSFSELATVQQFRAVIYFNVSKTEAGAPFCNPVDWRVYRPDDGTGDDAFVEAVRILEGGDPVGEPPVLNNHIFIPLLSN
ncbi:MAG: hypothetical protein GTO18_14555 [Anaerolineales bacterium]|nr:hypothetical protein [Anaerolineales bacterium]